jgi:hypothetical protein
MTKTIWATILEKDEAKGKALFEAIHRYGLGVNGHFWLDDLDKMQWAGAYSELSKPDTVLWVIKGTAKSFADPSIRYGLSLLAAMTQAARGQGFPIVLVCEDKPLDPATLPTPLKGATIIADDASFLPKLVAKANTPAPRVPMEYRLDIHPLPGLGQWFEAGPAAGHLWSGVIFGACGAEVDAHGVGPKGSVPEKCVLEYAMKGVKFTLGQDEYVAWAVKNALDENTSYYVRVKGYPASVAFGSLPDGDEGEMFAVSLK